MTHDLEHQWLWSTILTCSLLELARHPGALEDRILRSPMRWDICTHQHIMGVTRVANTDMAVFGGDPHSLYSVSDGFK